MAASLEQARAAKEKVIRLLWDHPDVRGVGVARVADGFGVKVNLAREPAETLVPAEVDGVPVRIEVVGEIRPL